MNKILLNDNFSIDLPTLVDTRLLVQANSGGGKSWLIRRLLEQSNGQIQQIVIDLEGEFLTLREKFDYILAGKGGDTPAEPRSAGMLAKRLLELNVSAIIDLYELDHYGRKRFVKLFLEALVNAPKDLWHPCLVIIDEAHVFCPEKGQSEASDAVIDLATRGRKRGFCAVLATQRLSKLHKDAAAECNNKLIGRTGLDIDRKRAAEELGFTNKDDTLSLRNLEPGEFYAFGPAISKSIEKIQIGPVQTSHPKAGSRILTQTTPPTDKIKSILSKLGDLPKEAEEEAQTMAELKAKIVEQKRTIRTLENRPTQIDQTEIDKQIAKAVAKKEQEFNRQPKSSSELEPALRTIISTAQKALREKPQPQTIQRMTEPIIPAEDKKITGGALRIMQVLGSRYPMNFTKSQLATLSHLSPRSGTYGTYLSLLKSQGLINQEGNMISLTEAGIDFVGDVPSKAQTPEEVINMWRNSVTGGARRMFDVLVNIYPDSRSKEDLGFETDMSSSSGTFGTYLSMLKRNGLVSVNGNTIKASEDLFA